MHEMGIAEAIVSQALEIASGRKITRIHLSIGSSQHVTAESLRFSYQLAASETHAEHAEIRIDIIPGDEIVMDSLELEDGTVIRRKACAPES